MRPGCESGVMLSSALNVMLQKMTSLKSTAGVTSFSHKLIQQQKDKQPYPYYIKEYMKRPEALMMYINSS